IALKIRMDFDDRAAHRLRYGGIAKSDDDSRDISRRRFRFQMRGRLSKHLRVDRSGGDRIHPYSERAPFDGERFGQAGDREFGSDINRETGKFLRTANSTERTDVHD